MAFAISKIDNFFLSIVMNKLISYTCTLFCFLKLWLVLISLLHKFNYSLWYLSLHCPGLPYRILWSSKWKIPKVWTAYLIFHRGWKILKHITKIMQENMILNNYIASWAVWRTNHRKFTVNLVWAQQASTRLTMVMTFTLINKNLKFLFTISALFVSAFLLAQCI